MGDADNGRGCACLGAGGIWEISVPSTQFYREPKTALKNTVCRFKRVLSQIEKCYKGGADVSGSRGPRVCEGPHPTWWSQESPDDLWIQQSQVQCLHCKVGTPLDGVSGVSWKGEVKGGPLLGWGLDLRGDWLGQGHIPAVADWNW